MPSFPAHPGDWPTWNWSFKGIQMGADGAPVVMSILNVTPDSFSDGGECQTVADAVTAAVAAYGTHAVVAHVVPVLRHISVMADASVTASDTVSVALVV